MTNRRSSGWQPFLQKFVANRPITLIRLAEREYAALLSTTRGISEFTLNIPHEYLRDITVPCMCLISGTRFKGFEEGKGDMGQEIAYVGVIRSKRVVATLDTRIKVERTGRISPVVSQLAGAIVESRHARLFAARLAENGPVTKLSPKLSIAIVDTLARTRSNHGPLRMVASGLEPLPDDPSSRFQGDAIDMALKAFGLTGNAAAARLELVKGKESRLVGARIMEDSVIEHDARSVPEYDLVTSDVTGRATFRKGKQTLEVITANRKKLEEVFGVDLIYVNHFHHNLVMVQYKMLEPGRGGSNDWTYTQDRHLSKQLTAMQRFARRASSSGVYRLSDEFFYFKFVRRFGESDTSFLLPMRHFQALAHQPGHPSRSKKTVRLSYEALDGRYMRQTAFYNLLQSGYIGADTATTGALQALIADLLAGGDALVVAIQRETTSHEEDEDRARSIEEWDDDEAAVH